MSVCVRCVLVGLSLWSSDKFVRNPPSLKDVWVRILHPPPVEQVEAVIEDREMNGP